MKPINESNFYKNKIEFEQPLVLYVKQNGCQGCIVFDPIYLKLERITQDKNILFTFMNYSPILERITSEQNIKLDKTPSLLFFIGGNLIGKYNGEMKEETILKSIKRIFSHDNQYQGRLPPLSDRSHYEQYSMLDKYSRQPIHSPVTNRPIHGIKNNTPGTEIPMRYDNDRDEWILDEQYPIASYTKPWESEIKKQS